jgi:predicted aspartyl protease
MGITHVTTSVWNLARHGQLYETDFLVDTVAIDCLKPSDALHAMGVNPEGRAVDELANGPPVEYEYGFARIAFLGEESVAQIIFGPSDAAPILGVVALENTGVVVDPVTKTLKQLHARLIK